ncbi:MAG: hypothetical protein Tsb002_26680 [Wenzhouxiangellaceae bacterium]
MQMRVKGYLAKDLREQRAWSQQHLADAAGISLRTVQRIEKAGQASPESTKALASTLGVRADELLEVAAGVRAKQRRRQMAIGIPALAGLLVSLTFLATTATAEPVMLDVSFSDGTKQLADVQLLTEPGEEASVILDNGWQVSLAPTLTTKGQVRISAKIHEPTDAGTLMLVSAPMLITDHRVPAVVEYTGDNGANLHFTVTAD